MSTAYYGSTLDALAANRLNEEKLAAEKEAAYRNYLSQIANTNVQRENVRSLDRYRQGDIGARQADTASMDAYRRGIVGNEGERLRTLDRYNQGQLANDAQRIQSQDAYWQGDLSNRNQALHNQYDLGTRQLEQSGRLAEMPYIKPTADALLRDKEVLAQIEAARNRQDPTIGAMTLQGILDQQNAARQAYATMATDYEARFQKQNNSPRWNDDDVERAVNLIDKGMDPAAAKAQVLNEKFRLLYPGMASPGTAQPSALPLLSAPPTTNVVPGGVVASPFDAYVQSKWATNSVPAR